MVADAILDCSARDDIVLDAFLGSGTDGDRRRTHRPALLWVGARRRLYRDRYGNVIIGHSRLLACRLLGITEVPTLCLDHLTPAQARAFMIADNRLTEIATWDDRLLARQFKDLSRHDHPPLAGADRRQRSSFSERPQL